MKAVGIKRLKAQLSEYVRMAKAGETILVTERDEVVAELRPARRQLGPRADLEELLDGLSDAGELTRAGLPKEGFRPERPERQLPRGAASRILDELRGDRGE